MNSIVVAGQVPPPFGGQNVMIGALVGAEYDRIVVHHVPMRFSQSMDEVGKPSLGKVFELIRVVARILHCRYRFKAVVLYYPPAGPDLVPLLRDVLILLPVRWAFRHTVFHFHASGVSTLIESLPTPLRWLARSAYGGADLAIILSERNPRDGLALGASEEVVIPYGIPDVAAEMGHRRASGTKPPVLLSVGVVRRSKGTLDLLRACSGLANRGLDFRCRIVGQFESVGFENELRQFVAEQELEEYVQFLGVRTGEAKWEEYRRASIFCFPTYFESESFGIVLLEAMQFGLPTVATRWRGIPGVVEEGVTGLLVQPEDPTGLSEALGRLLLNDEARAAMGEAARRRYERHFTQEAWLDSMENALASVAAGRPLSTPARPMGPDDRPRGRV